MNLLRRLLLGLSKNEWLNRRLPRLGFVRRSVRRFIPGEELSDALRAAETLSAEGIASVLTELGENVESVDDARATVDHYREVLERAGDRPEEIEVSVKLTHLGLDLDRSMAADHLLELARTADATGSFVWVDMEESRYVDDTLEVVEGVRAEASRVGVCLQAYLHRTPKDLARLLEEGTSVRLVKGAYREPPELALQEAEAVNRSFLSLARPLLESVREHGVRHAFATHDGDLVEAVREEAGRRGVEPGAYEFQLLYGIREELARTLAREGHRVRILISYGSEWFAWYVRRLAERPANLWLLLRNLV